MTIAKDSFLTKATVAIVAFAAGIFMLGGAAVAPAYAQSDSDLQAQIQSLLETIASLQSQIDGGSSAGVSGSCPSSIFTANLGVGSEGQTVKDLQMFLNMSADTRVSTDGPGSPGNETIYYGSLTADAVSDFQSKYASNVLTPVGLSAPTGYWGNSSASHAQTLCAQWAAQDEDDADDSDDDADDSDDSDDDSDSDNLSGGEASIDQGYDLDDVDDVQEGSSAEVADVEFDVEDGDVRVSRIDVSLFNSSATSTNGDNEPWDVFEEVSIMVDGDEIASMNANDEDDYLDEDGEDIGEANDAYTIRFNNVDWVVRDGDTAEFTIAVETQSSVDDVEDGISWTVYIGDEGIRAVDSAGIQNYTGDDNKTAEFDIEEEGVDDDLDVNTSFDDPDESVIMVDEDDTSDEYGVFAFEIESGDNDVEFDKVTVRANFASMTYLDGTGTTTGWFNDIVSDAYLEIDGEQFSLDDETVEALDNSTGNTDEDGYVDLEFDIDGDYTLDGDDEVTAMLFLEFESQGEDEANYNNGVTVSGEIQAGAIEGEGADDVDSTGTALGETHTLLSSGVYAADAADTDAVTQGGDNEDRGFFTFEVDITAFESDAYLSTTGTTSFDISLNGPNTDATSTVTLRDLGYNDETVDTADYYVIRDGQTETFEIEVTVYDLASADEGNYFAVLNAVNFFSEAAADADAGGSDGIDGTADSYDFSPSSDYDTSTIWISQDAA